MIDNKDFSKYIHKLLLKPYDEELKKEDLLEIKKMVLNKYSINREEIDYSYTDFTYFINLENLSLEFMNLTDDLITSFSLLPKLKNIEISFGMINTSLQFKNKFESIILNSVSNEMLKVFENAESVKKLILINIENIDARELEKFSHIEELCIYNSKISYALSITKLNILKKLKLDGSNVENEQELIAKLSPQVEIKHNLHYYPGT